MKDNQKDAVVTQEEIGTIENFYHQTIHSDMSGDMEERLGNLEETLSKVFMELKEEITNIKITLSNMEERSLSRLADTQAKAP